MEQMKTLEKVHSLVITGCLLFFYGNSCFAGNLQSWRISKKGDIVCIQAGMLTKNINCKGHAIVSDFLVNGNKFTGQRAMDEIGFVLWKASPNEEPQGIGYSTRGGVEQSNAVKNQTDALAVKRRGGTIQQQVQWVDSINFSKEKFSGFFNRYLAQISELGAKSRRLKLIFFSDKASPGVELEINYEIYEGFPVIRKWMEIHNRGDQWIKISDLVLEKPGLTEKYKRTTLLTPNSRGFDPSIVAFSDSSASTGVILANEAPSRLRRLSIDGTAGYNPAFFEWVVGPGESFESDPVFTYAFAGKSFPTVSAVSTALDRCVESDFHTFLCMKILLPEKAKSIAPVFCSWTNYSANINDGNMRIASDIASRMGFKCFQLDAGWSDTGPNGGWAVTMPKSDQKNFSDLKGMSDFIRSKNMKTGLWYSDFISEKLTKVSEDKPPLFSLPLIRRDGGLGLSFCFAESREKYVREILYLQKNYQADYFKQDLSNVCYGDLARGHESRTLKESYLRGLRGLLAAQDEIHLGAPEVWLQLSHEIYWETPGPEADIAVLKHVDSYHSAPNEYWGSGNRSKLVSPEWKYNADSLKQKLVQGALRARNLWYAHRGLPLNRIEVFGAVTTNFNGSLSPQVIDRQICSWLMGSPVSFSGDLNSLTEANIGQYHNRFTTIEALEQKYGIYSHFQYSGVPGPTDTGWHWWGKLNADGYGIVVVLRGNSDDHSKRINVPWVNENHKYHLTALFSGKDLGNYSGAQLQKGGLTLELDKLGQEILELSIAR
jgi:hypothetical protein